jgi:hypothetical protein
MTGRCLCGDVTYELSGDLIATAICHCDHCQRQGGGAFSVNLVAHESQLTVTGSLTTYEETGEHDDGVYVRRRFCGSCGSPIVSELVHTAGVVAVKAGSQKNPTIAHAIEEVKGRGIPGWLTFDAGEQAGRIMSLPTREQINLPVQEQLIVELYSK